jgi:hypothetical protein
MKFRGFIKTWVLKFVDFHFLVKKKVMQNNLSLNHRTVLLTTCIEHASGLNTVTADN